MKPLLLLFVLFRLVIPGIAQEAIDELLKKAAAFENSRASGEALKTYQEVLHLQPVNLIALCKSSELCSVVGNQEKNQNTRETYYEAARKYAEIALKVNPRWSDANLMMALAMGRMALISGGRDRIKAVNEIRTYAEKAILYDPGNYKAYHVLGRWCYEVSKLGFFERTAAKILFGGVPKSSFAEAIRYYEKSRSIAPDFSLNYLECAKAYEKNGQLPQAILFLKQLQTMPPVTDVDVEVLQEGKLLLAKLQK